MTTVTAAPAPLLGRCSRKDRAFGVFAVLAGIAIATGLSRRGGTATFSFDVVNGADLPELSTAVAPTIVALGLAAAAIGLHQTLRGTDEHELRSLSASTALLVVAFLTWAAADTRLVVVPLLATALRAAAPIALGALAGVVGEKAGIINIAIEGQLLVGAMSAVVVSSLAGPWAGLVAAMGAALFIGMLLAVFSIKYRADQIIVGVVLVVLGSGLTGFLIGQLPTSLNAADGFRPIAIPVLSTIPVLGPLLFRQTVIIYLMLLGVPAVTYLLYGTRWGLRVRAVGEKPKAADTVGISVPRMRYQAVAVGSLLAGIGGAFFTLDASGQFTRDMTAGLGFIALAAVLVGRHHPVGAFIAALIFGFANALATNLGILGVRIDSNLLATTPYVVTILVVAGVIGRVRVPAAGGQPYVKE